nr:MAG TPA: hypothetical protein [Caudoviricetes sp.]
MYFLRDKNALFAFVFLIWVLTKVECLSGANRG